MVDSSDSVVTTVGSSGSTSIIIVGKSNTVTSVEGLNMPVDWMSWVVVMEGDQMTILGPELLFIVCSVEVSSINDSSVRKSKIVVGPIVENGSIGLVSMRKSGQATRSSPSNKRSNIEGISNTKCEQVATEVWFNGSRVNKTSRTGMNSNISECV